MPLAAQWSVLGHSVVSLEFGDQSLQSHPVASFPAAP